jgi:hypothetical protein
MLLLYFVFRPHSDDAKYKNSICTKAGRIDPDYFPIPPGYLDPERYATFDGVRFRVFSLRGEWLAPANASQGVAGRSPDLKIDHDRRLLGDCSGVQFMDNQMTKARLLVELRAARSEWDTLMAAVGEERNQFRYHQVRQRPLAQVLIESHEVFERLLEMVEAHQEDFLIQPQLFEGQPEPILVWKLLEGDRYAHYRDHIVSVRAWLAQP